MVYPLALAEIYVQGVSTRKVAKITEELCGFEISSTQVSRATAMLDEQLIAWREFLSSLKDRALHGIKYFVSAAHEGLKMARTWPKTAPVEDLQGLARSPVYLRSWKISWACT